LRQKKHMLKKIDVDGIFKNKNPALYKLLPKFIFSYLKKIIHQEKINSFLERHSHEYDFDFVRGIITEFGIKVKVIGLENIPPYGGRIFASNHPLGALDAMAILDEVGKIRRDAKFVVNDLLLNLENLKNIFVGVNKTGKSTSKALDDIEKMYAMDSAVFTFPSGLASRKQYVNGIFKKPVIKDLEWKKSFISRSRRYHKNIIPVYVNGRNSNFFYNLSLLRKLLGITANLEMLYLVDEMYQQHNQTITLIFGKEIPWQTFDKQFSDVDWAKHIKEHVYVMGEKNKPVDFQVCNVHTTQ
jgi:putative hemolysin